MDPGTEKKMLGEFIMRLLKERLILNVCQDVDDNKKNTDKGKK